MLSFVPSPLLLQYTLYYSTDSSDSISDSQSVTGLTTQSNGMGSYVLDKLAPRTVYFLRMRAINDAGEGAVLQSVVQSITFGIGMQFMNSVFTVCCV